jgi:hypothetical protein
MAENRDTLSIKQAAKLAGYSVEFFKSNTELMQLLRLAIKNDWFDTPRGQAMFQKRFEASDWFKQNAVSARGYLMAQAQGGADFEQRVETAREQIKARAVALGAEVDDAALGVLTEAYFMQGWGEPGREGMLDKALSGQLEGFDTNFLNFKAGGPDAIMTSLRENARANGLDYGDSYYQQAVTKIIGGESTMQDYLASQRQLAASADPLNAKRIMAGENRRDIYSPYISTYAKMFDMDPNGVELDDPNLKMVFNTTDDKGNPTAMGLWDYEKALRKTDGWQYTRDAHDRVANLTGEIVRMFGFGG